jgi:drug/metabolite transporter (DMT)-like permease
MNDRFEMRSRTAPFFVLAAGVLWGCMGLLVRSMSPYGFTSMEIVFFRAVVTGILMLLFMLIGKRKELKIRLKDLWCFLGTGLASVVFFNFCYFFIIYL